MPANTKATRYYEYCRKCSNTIACRELRKRDPDKRRRQYIKNREKERQQTKAYKFANKDLVNERNRVYRQINRRKMQDIQNKKRKESPLIRIRDVIRIRTAAALKRKSFKKNSKFAEYLGCTPEELKSHLESKFQPGMTWDNYSLNGWHIDHIVPLASASSVEELYKLCHYTNLQPLWALENLRKGKVS